MQCTSWVSGSGDTQNGVAFRIFPQGTGWNSVVLERNIWGHGYWDFVVIYFHTDKSRRTAFDSGPAADLGTYLGRSTLSPTYPLRICAQMKDNTLSFAVAKGTDPMVPLGTPGRGAVLALNPRLVPAIGKTGTYIGHVPVHTTAVMGEPVIDGVATPPTD